MRFKTKKEFITRVMAGERFTSVDGAFIEYYYDNNCRNPFRAKNRPMTDAWDYILTEEFELIEPEPITETRWRMALDKGTFTNVTGGYYNQVRIDEGFKAKDGWYKLDSIEVEVKS